MRSKLILASLALPLALPATAAAQGLLRTPTAELFGGYSYLRESDESFHGWNGSIAYNLGSHLGLVADLSAHNGSTEGVDLHSQFFMGGVRLSLRQASSAFFVQGLAGGVRARGTITVFGASISESETHLCYGPGAGVDVAFREAWAVRLQGDYLFVDADSETLRDPRISLGVVYRVSAR
jgi:opacity protein-like surface antigen